MEKQSGDIPLTLTAAYEELHINDPTISDKEVGVAYLRARGSAVEQPTEALQIIANAGDSRWLQSTVIPIPGPLTEGTVTTLQDRAHSVSATTSDTMVQPSSNILGAIPTAMESFEGQERADEKANAIANEEAIKKANEEASETVDTDEADSLELDSLSSQSTYAPSSSEEYASDSILEADSDDVPDYEAWFDRDDENSEGGIWTCDCGEAFVDGKCPYGHCGLCKSCGWNIVGDCLNCPKTCQGCGGNKVSRVCAECDSKKEESKVRRDIIIFDDTDGVWRCSECQWEIEADNETEGNCHCEDEEGWMRMVDFSQIPEYERADDAASSTESSSDEEGDSDDEYFIDDRENVMEDERADSDEAKEAAQRGGSMDWKATLDGHDLTFPTSSEPDNSKV